MDKLPALSSHLKKKSTLIGMCEISPRHNVTQTASKKKIYAHNVNNHEKERKIKLSWDSSNNEKSYLNVPKKS